jgi:hypothetical protein
MLHYWRSELDDLEGNGQCVKYTGEDELNDDWWLFLVSGHFDEQEANLAEQKEKHLAGW